MDVFRVLPWNEAIVYLKSLFYQISELLQRMQFDDIKALFTSDMALVVCV